MKKIQKVLFLACAITASSLCLAEGKINKIVVVGNERVEASTILSYLPFKEGGNYSADKLDEATKALHATSLFGDVHLTYQNGVVQVKLQENPLIARVSFEGNDKIKDEILQGEISSSARSVYTLSKVQNDVNRIIEIYNKGGYYSAKVTPRVKKLPDNRTELIYAIKEGSKAKIKKINFVGNQSFTSRQLKEHLLSEETKFYRFFTQTDHYDSDIVEQDKLNLTKFYNNNGFADFRVVSAVADLIPERNAYYITFNIEEGAKFNFGNINLTNNLGDVNTKALENLILPKKNELYRIDKLDATNEMIIHELGRQGFPFVDVSSDIRLNFENNTVDVNFIIKKAKKAYIGKINFKGNQKTYNNVIRREFGIAEGDPFNQFLIDQAEQRINNLDYFKSVTIEPKRTENDEVIDVDVIVEEKSTAELKFSAGYSTSDGALGMINLNERNFLGKGQRFSVGVSQSAQTRELSFGFTEPCFLGSSLAAGFDVATSKHDSSKSKWGSKADSNPIKSTSNSIVLHGSYNITHNLGHRFFYGYQSTSVKSTNPMRAPLIVNEQTGNNTTSYIGQRFSYDRLNNAIKPTRGYALGFEHSLAGIGGKSKYLRNKVDAAYYKTIIDDVVFKLLGEAAIQNSYGGKYIRIDENYNLGDQSFRGFASSGIGPRDKTIEKDSAALGGKKYFKGTAEVTFPVGLPKELEVTGAVFSDFGSLWGVDIPKDSKYKKEDFYDNKSLRASVGCSLIMITIVGPIRLDFAKAVKKQKFDKTQSFHLSFSTNF